MDVQCHSYNGLLYRNKNSWTVASLICMDEFLSFRAKESHGEIHAEWMYLHKTQKEAELSSEKL